MIILIPMAGRSERFIEAGYGPKHELPLGQDTVFDWVVSGFRNFRDANFVFVTCDSKSDDFVWQHAVNLGIPYFQTVRDESQCGYGAAAFNGLRDSGLALDQPVLISPIDTYRPHFKLPWNLNGQNFMEFCAKKSSSEAWHVKIPAVPEEPSSGESQFWPLNAFNFLGQRGTGLFFFQEARAFTGAYQNRRVRLSIPGQKKLLEHAEWALTLASVNKRSPVALRVINRSDVVFMGNPKEYAYAKRHWHECFRIKPPLYHPTLTS